MEVTFGLRNTENLWLINIEKACPSSIDFQKINIKKDFKFRYQATRLELELINYYRNSKVVSPEAEIHKIFFLGGISLSGFLGVILYS